MRYVNKLQLLYYLSMKFCDNCGNLFRVTVEENNRVLHCRSCGNKKPITENIMIETVNNKDEQKIVIIDDKEQNTFPVTSTLCPKCGELREAHWTMQQTRGGDEPPTRFYQCTTCKHRWREYS